MLELPLLPMASQPKEQINLTEIPGNKTTFLLLYNFISQNAFVSQNASYKTLERKK